MFLASSIAAFLARDAQGAADRGRRGRRDHARGRALLRRTTARSSTRRSSRSTGTTRAPRRAATRRSCSRRSTSSRRRCARRSATAPRRGKLVLEGHRPERARDPEPAPDRDRRLRHRVPRRRRRALHHRGVGARPGRAGHRERVALPQPGAVEGHARDRDHAVRRDGATRSPRCGSPASRARARSRSRTSSGTQITREVDAVLYTRAGLEVGVAATKTFTAQVALLSLIALKLAQIRAHAARGGDRVHPRRALRPAGEDGAVPRRRPSDRGDRAAALRQARSSSTSAATSACRSRSRAR